MKIIDGINFRTATEEGAAKKSYASPDLPTSELLTNQIEQVFLEFAVKIGPAAVGSYLQDSVRIKRESLEELTLQEPTEFRELAETIYVCLLYSFAAAYIDSWEGLEPGKIPATDPNNEDREGVSFSVKVFLKKTGEFLAEAIKDQGQVYYFRKWQGLLGSKTLDDFIYQVTIFICTNADKVLALTS